jgi:hypothetical protein
MPSEVEASLDFPWLHTNALMRVKRRTPNIQRSMKKIAGGGARTHTILRSLDFESSASANSATPAFRKLKLRIQEPSSSSSDRLPLLLRDGGIAD